MWEIVLATTNQGKVNEMNEMTKALPDLRFISQQEFGVEPIEEVGLTFYENAIAKARHASQQTGLPALADDSGLCVSALGGSPGIISARYAGENATDNDNINLLLQRLEAASTDDRSARFHSVVALINHYDHPCPTVFSGTWKGEILHERQGEGGFGYDPVFYVPTHECSAAELDLSIKNSISHRGQAMSGLLDFIRGVME
jgi:XTP/dITP diphosphohydrolase